jgi:hypothetical protein
MRRLALGLAAVVCASAATFVALVGLATWLFFATPPFLWPRGSWVAGLLAGSVVLAWGARRAIAAMDRVG